MKKVFKFLGYTLGVLVLLAVAIVVVGLMFDPRNETRVLQTLTVGDKTVHVVGKGAADFTSSASSEGVIINGVKLDLSGGSVFTATIMPDGKTELKKGAP